MLKKFAVTNFRGFANRIEWDLSNPSNYEFSQYAIKDGIIKNAIIYGQMLRLKFDKKILDKYTKKLIPLIEEEKQKSN